MGCRKVLLLIYIRIPIHPIFLLPGRAHRTGDKPPPVRIFHFDIRDKVSFFFSSSTFLLIVRSLQKTASKCISNIRVNLQGFLP